MKKVMRVLVVTAMVLSLGIAAAHAEDSMIIISGDMSQEMPGGGPRGGQPPMEGEAPPALPEGMDGMEPPVDMEGMTPPEGGKAAPRREGQGEPMGEPPMMLDTDGLRTAIAALDLAGSEADVSALLEAYIDALEAERAVMDNGVGNNAGNQEAMEDAKLAVEEARAQLEATLSILGIDIAEYAMAMEERVAPEGGVNG